METSPSNLDNAAILEPVRQGWLAALQNMAQNGDDQLLDSISTEWDDGLEWIW